MCVVETNCHWNADRNIFLKILLTLISTIKFFVTLCLLLFTELIFLFIIPCSDIGARFGKIYLCVFVCVCVCNIQNACFQFVCVCVCLSVSVYIHMLCVCVVLCLMLLNCSTILLQQDCI